MREVAGSFNPARRLLLDHVLYFSCWEAAQGKAEIGGRRAHFLPWVTHFDAPSAPSPESPRSTLQSSETAQSAALARIQATRFLSHNCLDKVYGMDRQENLKGRSLAGLA